MVRPSESKCVSFHGKRSVALLGDVCVVVGLDGSAVAETRDCPHRDLCLLRDPISSSRHTGQCYLRSPTEPSDASHGLA